MKTQDLKNLAVFVVRGGQLESCFTIDQAGIMSNKDISRLPGCLLVSFGTSNGAEGQWKDHSSITKPHPAQSMCYEHQPLQAPKRCLREEEETIAHPGSICQV